MIAIVSLLLALSSLVSCAGAAKDAALRDATAGTQPLSSDEASRDLPVEPIREVGDRPEPEGELAAEGSSRGDGVAAVMDVIDVGTGLAVLVRGVDFAVLYDAGSKEDIGRGEKNRVLAFLRERHPDLSRLDHVILSHPHRDHVNLLEEIIEEYEVAVVWDVGLLHATCPYARFLHALSRKEGVLYRSGARGPGRRSLAFAANPCEGTTPPPREIEVTHGPSFATGERVRLGRDAWMTFLHVDPTDRGDPNENSLVVRMDIAGKRLLLMGDAKGGKRRHPSSKPDRGSVERELISAAPAEIVADVLVVGHHGSHTSSRTAFLDAVGAKTFVVSVGRASLEGHELPSREVMEALEERGRLLRTDARDGECTESELKVGARNDGIVGGCDNIRIVIPGDDDREVGFEIHPAQL